MDFRAYKAVLFDVDKTLSNSSREITAKTKEVLTRLPRKDITIGLCTGRSYSTLQQTLSLFPTDSVHVVAGGAQLITNVGIEKKSFLIDEASTRLILSSSEKSQDNLVISYGDTLYTDQVAHKYSTLAGEKVSVCPLKSLPKWNVPIITIFSPSDATLAILASMQTISMKHMISYGGLPYVDITAIGINKSSGVNEWCKITGIQPEEVIGFGDSENDIEFLRTVGYSVAMGNSTKDVQSIAHEVTEDCDHDGVAVWIERNIK